MAEKISTFAAEDETALSHILDDWEKVCLATGPADRKAAEAAISDAYRLSGLEPPVHWVWLGSPLSGAIAAAMLAVGMVATPEIRTGPGFQARDRIRGRIPAPLWERTRQDIGAWMDDRGLRRIWTAIWKNTHIPREEYVWDRVGDQLWAQIGGPRHRLGAQVSQDSDRVRLDAAAWDQVARQCRQAGYGQHDAAWLAFCDVFRRSGRVDGLEPLESFARLARAAGWWWSFKGVCIVTERPTLLHRDPEGRLHHTDGPALLYPDGWAIHALHGRQVPAALIEDRSLAMHGVAEAVPPAGFGQAMRRGKTAA